MPSEIHPLETRATGQAVTVFTNFMASFIIGQFFNSMLCKMQVRPLSISPLLLLCTYQHLHFPGCTTSCLFALQSFTLTIKCNSTQHGMLCAEVQQNLRSKVEVGLF